jgi:hypothetical protein
MTYEPRYSGRQPLGRLPQTDTTGDVGLAGDELDRQLDGAAAVGLLLV